MASRMHERCSGNVCIPICHAVWQHWSCICQPFQDKKQSHPSVPALPGKILLWGLGGGEDDPMGEESGKVQTPLRSLEEHDERVRREDIREPGDTNP